MLFGSVLFGAFWALLEHRLLPCYTVRRGLSGHLSESLATARTGVEKPAHAQRCSVAGFNSASPTGTPPCHSVSSASLSHCFYYIKKDVKSLFLLVSFLHFSLAFTIKREYTVYIKLNNIEGILCTDLNF